MGIYIDLDFYEIDATNVKTITGILWLDNSTMIFVTPERATVINIPDPKKVARDMRDAANVSDYDEENGHIEMDELMCETSKSLGYGEAAKAFKNACKRHGEAVGEAAKAFKNAYKRYEEAVKAFKNACKRYS